MHKYNQLFGFDVDFNWKTLTMLAFLAVFPNVLGMLNISFMGFKLHFFQYLVFVAAFIYGPFGGAVSGAFGSVYSAIVMGNPYIVIGNVILGFFAGLFFRFGWHGVLAVLGAYLVQMPWLWFSDVYLIGLPTQMVKMIVVALLVSDLIWGALAKYTHKPLKRLIL